MPSIANTIVRTWELAQHTADWQRPAAILSALTGVPLGDALGVGVGRRDAALLSWRAVLFGEMWLAFAQCARCGEMLEYELPRAGVAVSSQAMNDLASDEFEVEACGRTWTVRWPSSRDLAEAAQCADRDTARSMLARRIVPAGVDGSNIGEVLAAVASVHRGCLSIELCCSGCSHKWTVAFHPGEFLWREIRVSTRRILSEVDSLARAYHWSEHEILSMTETRRRGYLEFVR